MRAFRLLLVLLVFLGIRAQDAGAAVPANSNIAVLLVNFQDDQRQPWTTGFVSGLFNAPTQSLDDFYRESSWGQHSLSADVYGYFVIPTAFDAAGNTANSNTVTAKT